MRPSGRSATGSHADQLQVSSSPGRREGDYNSIQMQRINGLFALGDDRRRPQCFLRRL